MLSFQITLYSQCIFIQKLNYIFMVFYELALKSMSKNKEAKLTIEVVQGITHPKLQHSGK